MAGVRVEGDPVLSRKAEPVRDVFAPEVQDTVNRLLDAMFTTRAMGFAAPQIGIPLRIFVFSSYPHTNHEDAPVILPTVVINPEILSTANPGKTWEKCYSLPGIRGFVPRFGEIETTYTELNGNSTFRKLAGFPAHLYEHETDHLNGLLYKARIKPEDAIHDIISEEEYKKRYSNSQEH